MDRSVVIMDNCSIHHDEDIRQIIEDECGMFVILEMGLSLLLTLLLHRCKAHLPTAIFTRSQSNRGGLFLHEGMASAT
jgi:hypothetical protein